MIYPNQAAADYEYKLDVVIDEDRVTADTALTGGGRCDLGWGNDFPLWGRVVSVYDVGDSVGRYRIQVFSTDLSINYDDDGTPFIRHLVLRFKFYDATLDAGCDHWELDASDLDIWATIGAGSETLIYTAGGPIHLEGDGYDPRENTLSVLPIAHLGPEDAQLELLPHLPSFGPSLRNRLDVEATGGVRYFDPGTVQPTVAVDQSFGVPEIEDCDCQTPPATIETEEIPTTWVVTFNASVLNDVDQNYLGSYTCYCDPDDHSVGIPTITRVYRMDWEYKLLSNGGYIYPTDWGLLESTRDAAARCSDPIANPDYYEDPFERLPGFPKTSTDSQTYIRYAKGVQHMLAYEHFGFVDQQGTCPLIDPEDPPNYPEPCAPGGHEICWYEASFSQVHSKPPCGEATDAHMWRDALNRLYAVLSGGSMIQVWRHRVGAEGDVQNVVAGDVGRFAQGAWHPSGRHHIVYRTASALVEIYSLSNCLEGRWSDPVEIGDFEHFAFAIDPTNGIEYVIVHKPDDGDGDHDDGDDSWLCYRKRPGDAAYVLRGTVVAGVATGRMAGLEIDKSPSHRLVAVIKTTTAMKRFYSLNQGETWL